MKTLRRTDWAIRINRIDSLARIAIWTLILVMSIIQHVRSSSSRSGPPQVTAPKLLHPSADAVASIEHS